MPPMLPCVQRVTRLRMIVAALMLTASTVSSVTAGTAWAGRPKPAHTSATPQKLKVKPRNLYSQLNPRELRAEVFLRFDPSDWPSHIERVTRGLLAAPYLLSPLGEGRGTDVDPRFRLDAFDCTTFVETTLALANSPDADRLAPLLDHIRYSDGYPSFQSRRHLMTSQWIPDLTKAGFIKDVTVLVGQEETRFVRLDLTPRLWMKRKVARTLPLHADRVPYGTYRLPYLPLALARKRARKIPPGSIINVVRTARDGSPDVITHQGVVVVRPGGRERLVRHASPISKRVIDESLEHMLHRYQHPKKRRKWPIVGINVLRIVPNLKRARRVGPPSAR